MPEGPEVKISADIIKPWLINKKITNLIFSDYSRYAAYKPESYSDFMNEILAQDTFITNIESFGKKIYIHLNNDWVIENSFGMTGHWSKNISKHNCFSIFVDNEVYFFNDTRHFAIIRFYRESNKSTLNKVDLLQHQTIDDKLIKHFFNRIKNKKISIAQILMDQDVFPGVGNYIRAEALYAAKLYPFTKGNELSYKEVQILIQECHKIMHESYNNQGATIKDFKNPNGDSGLYSFKFKVYDQKYDSNNFEVKKDVINNRTIHWVPEIQKRV